MNSLVGPAVNRHLIGLAFTPNRIEVSLTTRRYPIATKFALTCLFLYEMQIRPGISRISALETTGKLVS